MKVLSIFVSLIFVSCNQPTPIVDNVEIAFLHQKTLLDQGNYCFIKTPIIYEDKLIVMKDSWEKESGWIDCYDKASLELLWTWNDAVEEFGYPKVGFGETSYIHNGVLCITNSNLTYGIDVENGSTIWRNVSDGGSSTIHGNGATIASRHIKDHNIHDYIKVADYRAGEWKNIYDHIKSDSLSVQLKTPLPFTWQGIEYVTFVETKWSASPPLEIYWLNLYNLSENKMEWRSDTIPLHHPLSGTPGTRPEFADGQILLANDAIYSYNVEDGSLEWMKWYGNSFVRSSHLTVAEGVVYSNNSSQFMVGLNVHTGEEKFNIATGGSASPIAFYNGKCYIASVTTNNSSKLMVIDGDSGEISFEEEAPFRTEDRRWTMEQVVAVDPETGLVYTGDHKHLLVYDFDE